MKPSKKELKYLINVVYNKLPSKYTKDANSLVVNSIKKFIAKLLPENDYDVNATYSKLKKDLNL